MIDGRVSAARALWLLGQLGEGTALWAAASGGPEFRAWTTATRIAAFSLNALNGANWQRSGGKGKKPELIEPPQPKGVARGRKKGPSALQKRIATQAALQRAQVQRGGLGVPAPDGPTQD